MSFVKYLNEAVTSSVNRVLKAEAVKVKIGPHDHLGLFRNKELLKTFRSTEDAKEYKKSMMVGGVTGDNLKIKKLTPAIIDMYDPD